MDDTKENVGDVLITASGGELGPSKSSASGVPVRLLYDTWDADENRHPAGAVVNLPLDAAKELLATGKAERADPLPGE